MNITTKTSLVGFLLALSTLALHEPATATTPGKNTIEGRLTRLTDALRERESQLNDPVELTEEEIARGWANGRNRSWVNGRGVGWGDGRGRNWINSRPRWGDGFGGGWLNGNNWRNGWNDRGGFFNNRGGGSFLNSR
jgi:rSAM-associated Gly-rich repeat protein